MNTQEIFNKVVLHLSGMKKQSLRTGGVCAYRGEGGSMCAVGCLISDEAYASRQNMEGFTASSLAARGAVSESIGRALERNDTELLTYLQSVHDRQNNWDGSGLNQDGWERLRVIADKFGLTVPSHQP